MPDFVMMLYPESVDSLACLWHVVRRLLYIRDTHSGHYHQQVLERSPLFDPAQSDAGYSNEVVEDKFYRCADGKQDEDEHSRYCGCC